MSRLILSIRPRSALLALALVLVSGAAAFGDVVVAALLQRPAEARGVVVAPDRFLRPWDPVTVFFPDARGRAGPADEPRGVRLTPGHPGAWSWLDARTLQFRPAEAWAPLGSVAVRVDDHTTELETLMTPPRDVDPADGATDLPPTDTVRLTFDSALSTADLARMLSFELRALPGAAAGEESARVIDHGDFVVKAIQRDGPRDQATYAVTLRHPVPPGTRVTVRLGLGRSAGAESVSRTTFTTAAPFRVESLGCPGGLRPVAPGGTRYAPDAPVTCEGDHAVIVRFDAEPAGLGPVEVRNLVRFEPAVEKLRAEVRGRTLWINADFEPERAYRVSLHPIPLADTDGRPLEMTGESSVSMWFTPRPAYLSWLRGAGVVERHGPQRLPMSGRGHGRADLRVARVDPLDRDFWPFPQDPLEVDEGQRPPGPGEEPDRWVAPSPIPSHEIARHLKSLGSPGVSALVDLPLGADGRSATFGLDLAPHLTRLGGPGAAGHYLVGLRPLEGAATRAWVRVQVTDLVLTTAEEAVATRFVITSLRSGRPVEGARVRVEGEVRFAGEVTWRTLFEARTDDAGAVSWAAPGREPEKQVTVRRVVVDKDGDVLVLDPARPPDAFAQGRWREGGDWLQWMFGDLDERRPAPTLAAHLANCAPPTSKLRMATVPDAIQQLKRPRNGSPVNRLRQRLRISVVLPVLR